MYFSWFKKYNHLYKDVELDEGLIDDFVSDCLSEKKQYEDNTREFCEETESAEENCEDVNDDPDENILPNYIHQLTWANININFILRLSIHVNLWRNLVNNPTKQ